MPLVSVCARANLTTISHPNEKNQLVRPFRCSDFSHSRGIGQETNVIVIMADDLGYGGVGCYGAKPKNLKTPHRPLGKGRA